MVRSSLRLLFLLSIVLGVWVSSQAAPLPVGPSELDDPVEPLKPEHQKSQEEKDRLEAVSLFAAGRIEEQRENYTLALKLYQRALRHDPQSLPILRQIIEVARQLNRMPEAMRYAMIAVELDPSDPRLVWALADQLAEQGHNKEALELCRKALSLVEEEKKSVVYVSLSLRVGQLAHDQGKHEEAADALTAVMTALDHPEDYGIDKQQKRVLLSDDGRIYELLADVFLSADRPKQAGEAYERLQKLKPNDGLHGFHLARIDAAEDRYDAALKNLFTYFKSHEIGASLRPYELLAEVLEHLDRKPDLIGELEKIRKDDPGNVPLRYYLAKQYRDSGKLAKAEPHYRDLLKQSPTADAYEGLVEIYTQQQDADKLLTILAEVAEKTGRLEAVKSALEKSLKQPELVEKLLAEARDRLKDDDPRLHGDALAAALVALETKQYDAAEEFYKTALDTRNDNAAELLLNWGQKLLGDDQFAGAVKVFRRGIDEKLLPEENPIFHTYLAMALVMDKKVDEALDVAREAAELADDNAFLKSRIPWVLYYGKRYDEAIEAYEKLIAEYESDYDSEDVRTVVRDARLAMSNLYVIKGDMPKAEESLERVLDEYPDNAGALNDLGYLWADQDKNLDRALEMIERAVATDPDNKAYRDSLGWVFYRLGRYQEAVEELKKATADDDVDGVILDHLGDAYDAQGDKKQAAEIWQRAYDKLKDGDDPKKAEAVKAKLDGKSPEKPQAAKKKKPPPE